MQQAAAQNSPDVRQRMENSVARQTTAATMMISSIGRQTGSVNRQLKNNPAAGFFTLPPPARSTAPLALQQVQMTVPEEGCEALPVETIDTLVNTASKREGVEPALIRGVMKQESGFRPCAVSPKGAVGLMQLMPRTASVLEVKDPFDPQDNVSAGTKLLRQLLQHYDGNLALTLGAYNAGPRRVDADMAVPGIPETTNYVRRILSMLPMDEMRDLSFDSGFDH